MNSVNFNDPLFKQTNTYKSFINDNKSNGFLSIRAYAANAAIPISNLSITVYKILDNQKVIFFEGATDNSGIISQISLPTPEVSSNDEEIPASIDYDVEAKYNNQNLIFNIKMFSKIQVNQNINIVPEIRLDGSFYGN